MDVVSLGIQRATYRLSSEPYAIRKSRGIGTSGHRGVLGREPHSLPSSSLTELGFGAYRIFPDVEESFNAKRRG